jgi:hypothetical protein
MSKGDYGLDTTDIVNECLSCGEGLRKNDCPKSKRPCGHHCNHSWSHDACCWCGTNFGEEPALPARKVE